jgi:hypothetical protein
MNKATVEIKRFLDQQQVQTKTKSIYPNLGKQGIQDRHKRTRRNVHKPFPLLQEQTKYPLSQDSRNVLRPIFQTLLENRSKWRTQYRKGIQETPILTTDSLPKGESYTYIPEEIRAIIEESNSHRLGKRYTCPFPNGRTAIIHMVGFEKRTTKPRFFENAIEKIYQWLLLADTFGKSNACSKTMNVYIYFTNHKKNLPKETKTHISLKHANTAFTSPCQETTEMNMFREEEWLKVFIHETFHNMGFDFSKMDESEWLATLQTMFQVEKDTRLYESYTEMWAEIVHMVFVTVYSSSPHSWKTANVNHLIERLFKQYEKNIVYEQRFACFQCAKVLRHAKMDYKTFAQPFNRAAPVLYHEETAAFSYFIIRSILLFHMNDFIKWSIEHNGATEEYPLIFSKTHKNVLAYCRLIQAHYKDPHYIQALEMAGQTVSNHTRPKWIETTLRMTVFEIDNS